MDGTTDGANAARCAMWADAAYCGRTWWDYLAGGNCAGMFSLPWQMANARGVIACRNTRNVVVGVAGTDDLDDWRNDLDGRTVQLGEFAQANGIYNFSGHARCRVHSGFANYANLALSRVLDLIQLTDYRHIWFTGHSLGGAAAVIMRWLLPPTLARRVHVVTFGAPGTHRGRHCGPCFGAPVLRVCRVTDPVPVLPPGFSHAASREMWLRYRGSVRSSLSVSDRIYRGVYVLAGAVSRPLRWLGYSPQLLPAASYAGHEIAAYRFDLDPLT